MIPTPRFVLAPLLALATLPALAQQSTDIQKVSSFFGHNIGSSMAQDGLEIDLDAFIEGMKAGLEGADSPVTMEEVRPIMQRLEAEGAQRAEQAAATAGDEAAVAGIAYRKEFGAKDGVTTTASGLQYEVITAAEGKSPTAEDEVKVHYHGTLIDGTMFDSSVERGEPVSFPLGGVIAGWTEGLQLMSVGSKFRFVIPSYLAYGPGGRAPVIAPNSTLVFEVELLEIN